MYRNRKYAGDIRKDNDDNYDNDDDDDDIRHDDDDRYDHQNNDYYESDDNYKDSAHKAGHIINNIKKNKTILSLHNGVSVDQDIISFLPIVS